MQRVVENEHRMAELHKKINRVEEVRFLPFRTSDLHEVFFLPLLLTSRLLEIHTRSKGQR